jgi:hypothetical protein
MVSHESRDKAQLDESARLTSIRRRSVELVFYIDTNRINARQSLPAMNQLEDWHRNGVISLQMAEEAHDEAIAGGNAQRQKKTSTYIYSTVPQGIHGANAGLLSRIEHAIFPSGVRTRKDRNDVNIVFNAHYYTAILLTADGASKTQPNGILGSREDLRKLGIEVMRDYEAVQLVRLKIIERDDRAKRLAAVTGEPLPQWVGRD